MAELDTILTSENEIDVDKSEAIADLLLAEEEGTTETTDQGIGETEELNEDTTEEVAEDESNEEGNVEEDDDVTWAGALGVEDNQIVLDDDGELQGINVNINGEVSTVGMPELIAGYQYEKHNTKKGIALADERKEFEGIRDEAVNVYSTKLTNVAKLAEYMQGSLMKEFNGVNWDQLRATDPAEYAAMMQDYNTRQGEVNNVLDAISQEQAEENNSQQALFESKSQSRLKDEIDKAIAKNPEWVNRDKFIAAYKDLGDFVGKTYGISENEYASVQDARFLELIQDAQKYRRGLKAADKKIPKNLPKFQKTGGSKRKASVTRLDKLTKASRKARGTEKRTLQQSAISELLMNEGDI